MTATPVAAPAKARSSLFARHPLLALIARRLVGLVLVLFVVVSITFLMVQLVPGDPLASAGVESFQTPAQRALLRHDFGLDGSLWDQYTRYLGRVVHGNLGRDFLTRQPVTELIRERISTSLQLAGAALLIVLLLSIPLGLLSAAWTQEGRRRRLEVGFTGVTSVLGAVPDYLTATVLAFLFAVQWRVFPVAGTGSVKYLVLPALAVSLAPAMILTRIVRVETLNVLAQDYIRTARSERLPLRIIYGRHVLPNVLTAALTVGGLVFSGIIGGAVIVENVFARPGLGSALIQAVNNKDYPVVQGVTLVLGMTVVVITLIVDVLIGVVDPRSLAKKA